MNSGRILISQSYRLYPTMAEARELTRWLGICSWIWNMLIEAKNKNWEEIKTLPKEEQKKRRLSWNALSAMVTQARNKYKSVASVSSYATREVCGRLKAAYKGYLEALKLWKQDPKRFHGKPEPPGPVRPEEYSVLDNWQPSGLRLSYSGGKFGHLDFGTMKDLKIRIHRVIQGSVRSATIRREPDGWYAKISFEIPQFPKPRPTERKVGVNLGVRNLVARTDGRKVEIPRKRWYAMLAKISRLDRIISRRKKGSNRRRKMEELRRKAFRKLVRMRDHFLGKWAHRLTRDFGTIVIEDMDLSEMIKASGGIKCRWTGVKAKSIVNAAVGKFVSRLEWKAKERSRSLQKIEAPYTTMTCSQCGHVLDEKLPLYIRTYRCPKCESVMDRERNAAANDLVKGLRHGEGV